MFKMQRKINKIIELHVCMVPCLWVGKQSCICMCTAILYAHVKWFLPIYSGKDFHIMLLTRTSVEGLFHL